MEGKKGFTLVELAIVLIVIGIILGAVLKGQELVFNAKVKRVVGQVKELTAAAYTYMDKYGALPGDDPTASSRWSSATDGDGDGTIDGGRCNSLTEESCQVYVHLRYANIISGNAAASTTGELIPKHAFGGGVHMFYGTYLGKTSHWILLDNLPADAAAAVDRALDDGKCDTGSVGRVAGASCSGHDYPTSGTIDLVVPF